MSRRNAFHVNLPKKMSSVMHSAQRVQYIQKGAVVASVFLFPLVTCLLISDDNRAVQCLLKLNISAKVTQTPHLTKVPIKLQLMIASWRQWYRGLLGPQVIFFFFYLFLLRTQTLFFPVCVLTVLRTDFPPKIKVWSLRKKVELVTKIVIILRLKSAIWVWSPSSE